MFRSSGGKTLGDFSLFLQALGDKGTCTVGGSMKPVELIEVCESWLVHHACRKERNQVFIFGSKKIQVSIDSFPMHLALTFESP